MPKNKIFMNLIIVLLLIILGSFSVLALKHTNIPYESYTYDYWKKPVPSPLPYIPDKIIDGRNLGVQLDTPQDMFVDQEDRIYLLDSGNDRIFILNRDFTIEAQINNINYGADNTGSREENFNEPRGIFVTENGEIYVADTGNNRIVVINRRGDLIKEIGAPVSDMIPPDFNYNPTKITVSPGGRIYVVSAGTYEGLIVLDPEGDFDGFTGAPQVSPDVFEYFWRRYIASETQRGKMQLVLPTEFTNIDIDKQGFLYTTASAGDINQKEVIMRLNPAGQDRLRRDGYMDPVGEVGSSLRDETGELVLNPSNFIDVDTVEYGIYNVLDFERGRVFTYNRFGDLLYTFGSKSGNKGGVRKPSALETFSDHSLLVLDSHLDRITLFQPTKYQQLIFSALEFYHTGRWEQSQDRWKQVLSLNNNYMLANKFLGETYLRKDQFAEAMYQFKKGQYRHGYSKAFTDFRRNILIDNFNFIFVLIISILILLIVFLKFKKKIVSGFSSLVSSSNLDHILQSAKVQRTKKYFRELLFSFRVIFHPFAGFWELIREKKGSLSAGLTLLVLTSFVNILRIQYTGFLFNYRDLTRINVVMEVASIIAPLLLWCVINWALTTLMEGKGTFRDIVITSVYSLTPFMLVNLPLTVISDYLTLKESGFYFAFYIFSLIWTFGLLFFGTMIIHEYTLSKSVLTVIMIIAGMAFSVFLALLFFNLTAEVINFFQNIYFELTFRI
ncbi:MAG: YIP1 family protein [bacterium]